MTNAIEKIAEKFKVETIEDNVGKRTVVLLESGYRLSVLSGSLINGLEVAVIDPVGRLLHSSVQGGLNVENVLDFVKRANMFIRRASKRNRGGESIMFDASNSICKIQFRGGKICTKR